jgi:tetratricopeptide (TPR) repeat protein
MSQATAQSRAASLLMAIGTTAWLGACSSTPKPVALPENEPQHLTEPAEPSDNPQVHFDRAMELLEQGKSDEADAQLHVYLEVVPKSKSARLLVEQIETPLENLFPKQSFRLRLPKNANLSSVAKTYLGNPLAFYGLARYNGIAVPAEVHEGQVLRIPKTPATLAARREAAQPKLKQSDVVDISQDETAPQPSIPLERSSPAAPTKPVSHVEAEHYYRVGLVAFQKQNLDGAIAAWHKALAADPGFTDAQVRLIEAERLKKSLKALQK